MSKLKITVSKIEEVKPHPNANKMELIRTKGWWCCTGLGNFKEGDLVVHFPPETLIPLEWAEKWSITKVCEEVIIDSKKYYKISVPKLRGIRSFGFCVKPELKGIRTVGFRVNPSNGFNLEPEEYKVGDDVTEYYGVMKYETPYIDKKYKIKSLPNLYKYNDIHQINEKNDMFKPDDEVVVTEKIHGMNFCVGLIRDIERDSKTNKSIYVSSSHRQRIPIEDEFVVKLFKFIKLKFQFEFNKTNTDYFSSFLMKHAYYRKKRWYFDVSRNPFKNKFNTALKHDGLREALAHLSMKSENNKLLPSYYKDGYFNDVLIYGEIYGNNIQDMKYGSYDDVKFRIFDIRINGNHINYDEFCNLCNIYEIPRVTELYRGKYKDIDFNKLSSGYTTICDPDDIKEPFKGKEGLVIKPVEESLYGSNDRKIAKYINPEYITRKNSNKTEYH